MDGGYWYGAYSKPGARGVKFAIYLDRTIRTKEKAIQDINRWIINRFKRLS